MRIVLLLLSAGLVFAQDYDLLLKGGHVIDPKNKISGNAMSRSKMAGSRRSRPDSGRKGLEDCQRRGNVCHTGPGGLSCPRLTQARTAYTGPSSVRPDDHSFRSGVTTMVDAGSSGWRNFEDFKKLIIDPARTRVLAMLNIVGAGMAGAPSRTCKTWTLPKPPKWPAKYKKSLSAFKTAHYAGPEWTPVENAVKAGEIAGLPVMVDFGRFRPERPFEELVTKKLRPGRYLYPHVPVECSDAGR